MYTKNDERRNATENSVAEDYRSEFCRDCSRLVHSPSFRRLQGKTQLFPGLELDFFRNRLTHSMEVSRIAKSIAMLLNTKEPFNDKSKSINLDICEFAGLAHDLGHPPFGHQGEEALNKCLYEYGGFEGNAQTLHILTRLEKKFINGTNSTAIQSGRYDERVGLNLTARSIASILKYDNLIPQDCTEINNGQPVKGYYHFQQEVVNWVKNLVAPGFNGKFKTIECSIMDIADDIAYSVYDLEDSLKADFIEVSQILWPKNNVFELILRKINKVLDEAGHKNISSSELRNLVLDNIIDEDGISPEGFNPGFTRINPNSDNVRQFVFTNDSFEKYANNGYFRSQLSTFLIKKFMAGIGYQFNEEFPALSTVYLDRETRILVEYIKRLTYEIQIDSTRLKIVEYRGQEIVTELFDRLSDDNINGFKMLPPDYRIIYESYAANLGSQKRVIADFIAGMTDKYAIEYYGRLKSENPKTIFKPI